MGLAKDSPLDPIPTRGSASPLVSALARHLPLQAGLAPVAAWRLPDVLSQSAPKYSSRTPVVPRRADCGRENVSGVARQGLV